MKNKEPLSMNEIQNVSFNILKEVAEFCECHGLRYFLMYGTLIGAVRHKGYIPWDDDVDIMMPRPDYEKFLRYCEKNNNRLGRYEIFNTRTNKNYIYAITRVSDPNYEIIKEEKAENCGMGVFIDIYPYDGLGNDYNIALRLLKKTRSYCDSIVALTRNEQSVPTQLNWKGKLAFIFRKFIRNLSGVKYYIRQLENQSKLNKYEDSFYVGPLMWYFTKPQKVLFKRIDFDKYVMLSFEGETFRAPVNYHDILTQEYGDYMQLPPVEKRIYQHQYKAYKKY